MRKQHDSQVGPQMEHGGWRSIDPLYVWSAAAGFVVAVVLIIAALAIQTARLH